MSSELNKCKTYLNGELKKSLEIIRNISDFRPQLDTNILNSLYELSFLKMYLEWERFLERTFILYMLGEETDNNYSPKRYVTPRDEQHAYEIIKGGARYPDWLSLEFVEQKAKLFFENGSPFVEALFEKANIKAALDQMKIIRNMIVHISPQARDKYESMVRSEFGSARYLLPGEFLAHMRNKPKSGKARDDRTYITYYKEILETASDEIVK